MRLAQTQVWPLLRNFGDQRAFDGGIEVGVVEDDEGRVAAQLQAELLDRRRALRHQLLPISVEPVKVSLRTIGLARHLAADLAGRAGDDAEQARRQAGALGQHRQRQRRKRRLRRRLQHHGAAGGQRRAGLAGDHRIGEVPRRDRGDDADRLLEDEDALVAAGGRG